jgi:hypothetical protein
MEKNILDFYDVLDKWYELFDESVFECKKNGIPYTVDNISFLMHWYMKIVDIPEFKDNAEALKKEIEKRKSNETK